MSSQFRYLQTYEQMVAAMLRSYPRDEAMARAVGGDFERVGVLEHAVLRQLGLAPNAVVVDIGCGAGRLAVQLARYPALRYLGTDVVAELLTYAVEKANRPDFTFARVERPQLPAAEGIADFVTAFSVFTHLLHEESYLYLQEAHRVLKPGGLCLFSFLEYRVEHAWQVFEANLDWVRSGSIAGHLNVFLHRGDIQFWAGKLGFTVEAFQAGHARAIVVDQHSATEAVPAGAYAFGQSLCVLRKPLPGELVTEPPAAAARPGPRPGARQRRG